VLVEVKSPEIYKDGMSVVPHSPRAARGSSKVLGRLLPDVGRYVQVADHATPNMHMVKGPTEDPRLDINF
jgi:hypothetical protein